MDLEGKVAVITGASRGLGAGIAEAALARGVSVVLCSRSAPLCDEGPRVRVVRGDVSKEETHEALVAEAETHFGHIDLWVNNAGLLEPVGPLRNAPTHSLREHFDVNILGVALGARAFLRHLHAKDRAGVLENVASGAGRNVYRGWAAYCAGKAAVDHLSRVIAREEADRLRVYAVAPGLIDTPMQEQVRGHSLDRFPQREKFRAAHAEGALVAPRAAGDQLVALAFDADAARDDVCIDLRD